MAIQHPHAWNVTPAGAKDIQAELRHNILIRPLDKQVSIIAGTDISFNKRSSTVYAGIAFLRLPALQLIGYSLVVTTTHFPYIPGLLSFREIPPLLEAWEQRALQPDAIMVDGQGIAHPRRMGIASHLGLLTGMPTIGCAKNVLTGTFAEPGQEKGCWSPLVDGEEQIGIVLRTKTNVKPVYISPGHLCDFDGARELAIQSTGKHKLPEPTRRAHMLVNQLREGKVAPGSHLL